jgi:hypothetical protein
MSIITETGTASTASESLSSVSDATAYFLARGNAAWSALTNEVMEQCLRKATDYLEAVYSQRWAGTRTTSTQALSWPRYNVFVNGYVTPSSTIPRAIVNACSELALKAAAGELLADTTQQKIRTKVDVLEVEYDKYSPQSPKFLMIESMLRPYLCNTSSIEHGLVR